MFRPTDPHDPRRTMIEAQEYREEKERQAEKERKLEETNTRRFWITTIIAGAAAVGALVSAVGVLIQLFGR